MDHFPQETLDKLRETVAWWRELLEAAADEDEPFTYEPVEVERFVERFDKLDEHLSEAGPLPTDWDR